MKSDTGIPAVPVRRLTRETRSVLEEVVRSGKPAIVTVHGRAEMVLVPLTGRLSDVPLELFGPVGAPPHVLDAIRSAEADIVGGKLLRGDSDDVVEREGRFLINMSLPGILEDGVNVKIDENLLTVDAYPPAHSGLEEVHRRVYLPAAVDPDDADVEISDGQVNVVVPRRSGSRPRFFGGGPNRTNLH